MKKHRFQIGEEALFNIRPDTPKTLGMEPLFNLTGKVVTVTKLYENGYQINDLSLFIVYLDELSEIDNNFNPMDILALL